jgi:hypothetical protein
MTPLSRIDLPRLPAVSAEGTALGNVVARCGCPIEGACERQNCPHRDRAERED